MNALLHPQRGRYIVWAFAATLLPFLWLMLHATPQVFDFCMGRFLHEGFWDGLVTQFQIQGHQFLGRTLSLLPIAVATGLKVDYFYVYTVFVLAAGAAFIWLATRVAVDMLPNQPRAMRVFGTVLFILALIGNAPSAREMLFSLPGFFTYALPGLLTAACFLILYHSMAAQRPFSVVEHVQLILCAAIAGLSNEWSGLALVALFLCSFLARLRLVPNAPEPISHAAAIGVSMFTALLVLLGPSEPVFTLAHMGSGLLWGLIYTPEFFVLRLPLPGILAWLLFLWFAYRPELRGNSLSDRHKQLAHFVFVSLFIFSFIAFVFGYIPNQSRLPARGQNQLYLVVLVALSALYCLVLPVLRYRLGTLLQRVPQRLSGRSPLLFIVILALLSPAWLTAVSELGTAGAFRLEQRARLAAIINRAEPTVYLAPLTAQPALLFDREISDNPNDWRNMCVADFFEANQVLPQPADGL